MLVPLASAEGQCRWERVHLKGGTSTAVRHAWRRQRGRTHCGPTTIAIACTALSAQCQPHNNHIDEDDVIRKGHAARAIDQSVVSYTGITLAQSTALAKACGLEPSQPYYCGEQENSPLRLREVLCDVFHEHGDPKVIIFNYHMGDLGQGESLGGHLSPCAAYDEQTDTALIMDTWPDTEPTWAPVDQIFASMRRVDAASGKSRGFVVVRFANDESVLKS